uniref:Uncharacterized protein n=1 Tax=Arundo donax TaxID=35708 RepID=A0A0A8Y716_ARUDO
MAAQAGSGAPVRTVERGRGKEKEGEGMTGRPHNDSVNGICTHSILVPPTKQKIELFYPSNQTQAWNHPISKI